MPHDTAAPASEGREFAPGPALDPDVLAALAGVTDPEIGIGIVDLGLVYRARRDATGVDVEMALTTQACPLGDLIVEEARAALAARFPATPARVRLVQVPAWTPDRITPRGRALLGHSGSSR
jgi:metal-sulfur cluster biosynthetic enzyme